MVLEQVNNIKCPVAITNDKKIPDKPMSTNLTIKRSLTTKCKM